MATSCSGVTTCLSEGSTECDLTSETCPPCVYALTGGDYSCYSRDTSGACPFSGTYAECDQLTTASTSSKSTSSKNSGSSSDTTPTPTTKTPAKTTATPATEAPTDAPTSVPATPTSGTSDSTSSQNTIPDSTSSQNTIPDSTSSQNTSDGTASTTAATAAPSSASTASSGSDATQSSKSGAEKALTSNTAATSGSPAIVNLALIGGAVVLVVIVLAFVARRVVKKKKMAATQEHTVSSGHNSAWSDRTLGTGTSGGNLYSTYSYKDEGGKGDGISMLSDSQASSTYGPAAYHGHPGSEQRPTADFSAYGGDSQYAENSQFYSLSTGPELLAAGAVAGAGHNYSDDGAPPSTQAGNHFVDVTATSTSMRKSELDSLRSGQQPLTVSQLMPTAIEEDEEEAYATRRQPGTQQYGVAHPTTYNFQIANAAVPPSSRKPQIFGASTASSMRSDYDIVDPITMRDVEARNTEMLAEDGRYPKFSFESEASSADLYDGDSSEEESSDDERVGHGEEHTI